VIMCCRESATLGSASKKRTNEMTRYPELPTSRQTGLQGLTIYEMLKQVQHDKKQENCIDKNQKNSGEE